MTDNTKNPAEMTPEEQEKFQLQQAKAQADKLGIKYSPNIGLDTLNEKIEAREAELADEKEEKAPTEQKTATVDDTSGSTENPAQRAARLRNEALKLVRVNVMCMNPSKKEWDGEIISVSNRFIGTVKKFVKFNTEDGYHIPQAILNVLEARQFQTFVTKTNDKGMKYREGKLVPEFNIQKLPALTQEELDELARKQAAADGKL